MKRTTGFWISTLLLAASLHATSQTVPEGRSNDEKEITVQVRNYAALEPAVLSKAETTASKILREAGADTIWVLCLDAGTASPEMACTHPPGPMDLMVNVLPSSMARAFNRSGEALGHATEDSDEGFGLMAWIFYDTISSIATEKNLGVAQLLGHALAHEVGHLLLGANSHSGVGLMRAPWSIRELLAADHGALFFTASESSRIRKAVLARRQANSRGVQNAEVRHGAKIRLAEDLRVRRDGAE